MRRMLCSSVVVLALWSFQMAATQAAEEASQPSERELRAAVTKAEKRFLDLYNRVNDDQRHAMSCQSDGVAGSRLRKGRTCRTEAASEISEDAARDYMRGLNLSEAIDAQGVT